MTFIAILAAIGAALIWRGKRLPISDTADGMVAAGIALLILAAVSATYQLDGTAPEPDPDTVMSSPKGVE